MDVPAQLSIEQNEIPKYQFLKEKYGESSDPV